jgi:hypothetical protein
MRRVDELGPSAFRPIASLARQEAVLIGVEDLGGDSAAVARC